MNNILTALVPPPSDSSLVMATESAHDVVNQTQSVGDFSPSDAPATQNHLIAGGEKEGLIPKQDGDNEQTAHALQIDETNSSAYSQIALSSVCSPSECSLPAY
jgi:hypothetical protein